MFWLLCFVSCVVGRTCGQTPLLAIYAIKYVYSNIPFSCSSWWRFIIAHTSGNTNHESKAESQTHETQNIEDKIQKTKVKSATKKNKEN